MLKLIFNLLTILILLTISSCIAGDGTIRCYSRLYSSPEKVKLALTYMWTLYPENRVDEISIRKIENIFPHLFQNLTFIDTSQCETCRSVLKSEIKNHGYIKEDWYIKSSDSKIIYRINIANISEWSNGFNCDVCIKYVIFMNKIEQNFMSWQLSKDQKKQAKKTFEGDILVKLKKTIKIIKKV